MWNMSNSAQIFKPLNIGIGKSKSVFQTQSTTYDQAGVTYDQAIFYGGSDRRQDFGGRMQSVLINKPLNTLTNQFPSNKTKRTISAGQPMLLWMITYPVTQQT